MLRRTAFALVVGIWALLGLVMGSLSMALFPESSRAHGAAFVLGTSVALWLVWAAFTPLVSALVDRFPLDAKSAKRSLPVHVGAAMLCIMVYTTISAAASGYLTLHGESTVSFAAVFRSFLVTRATVGLLAYSAIAGVTIAMDERRVRREQGVRALRLEAALARTQLQTLQMQLQPHFLFNTLHAVQNLIHEDPAMASKMVTRLGELLRLTLSLTNVPQISLREEHAILLHYLEIEQIRFGERLRVTVNFPAHLLDLRVPTFILQPIVENAIRHGISRQKGRGHIAVTASRAGDDLLLVVEDNGPGFSATADGRGLGLTSSRERLAVLFGDSGSLACSDGEAVGARVAITLPAAS